MLRTLVVGLGRAGAGLHIPVLLRLRREPGRRLFADGPILAVDPRPAAVPGGPEVRLVASPAAARQQLDPARTVVHLCTPPEERTALVRELVELGFRRLIIEKPLSAHHSDLAALARLVRTERLAVSVVAPWLASTLTERLEGLVVQGELGPLRRISVRQHKPRIRRSLHTHGHPTAFDIEIPHSLGVALRLAGDAEVVQADCQDLRVGDQLRPALASARLVLAHRGGVRTEIVSNLASPIRERRITLRFQHGTATGHYPGSADDEYAHLRLSGRRLSSHEVFPDDSLSHYLRRAYDRFLDERPLPPAEFEQHVRAVGLLADAKRISRATARSSQPVDRELELTHAR
ncbi:Gfo/Idh/MocA family oxidoreductase [Kitasatospora sp. NPDC052896]|uniref:Gfo/Idh/MocA family oxidoreductase n=1 Tax=Kitasatospora sp. NPDC052896 TaxID=3364061 RepID=UPI0037C60CD9